MVVLNETGEVLQGIVLVEAEFGVMKRVKTSRGKILDQFLFGCYRDRVTIEPSVPQEQFIGQGQHVANEVNWWERRSSFQLWIWTGTSVRYVGSTTGNHHEEGEARRKVRTTRLEKHDEDPA